MANRRKEPAPIGRSSLIGGTGGRVSIVPSMFLKGQWPRPLCPAIPPVANKQTANEQKNGAKNKKEERRTGLN